jgi:integrase
MNAADLYECAADVDGKITYERKKTRTRRADRAKMTVTIPDEAKLLVEHYRGRKGRLFRFSEMYSSTNNFNRALNLGLKQIGKVIGVENLQFYAARHTWATLAVNDVGINKYVVHQALNHVDEKTAITDVYIRKSWDAVDAANRKVIDFVFGHKKTAPILSDERGFQTINV